MFKQSVWLRMAGAEVGWWCSDLRLGSRQGMSHLGPQGREGGSGFYSTGSGKSKEGLSKDVTCSDLCYKIILAVVMEHRL